MLVEMFDSITETAKTVCTAEFAACVTFLTNAVAKALDNGDQVTKIGNNFVEIKTIGVTYSLSLKEGYEYGEDQKYANS